MNALLFQYYFIPDFIFREKNTFIMQKLIVTYYYHYNYPDNYKCDD